MTAFGNGRRRGKRDHEYRSVISIEGYKHPRLKHPITKNRRCNSMYLHGPEKQLSGEEQVGFKKGNGGLMTLN